MGIGWRRRLFFGERVDGIKTKTAMRIPNFRIGVNIIIGLSLGYNAKLTKEPVSIVVI